MNTSIKTPPTTNASIHDKEEQNYTNLQQALRAATAALQKSKISTNMVTSQPMSKSNVNLTSQSSSHTAGALSFQPYTKQQQERPNAIHKRVYKNTLNLKIESNANVNSSHYDNIEDNIDISVNLANCAAAAGDETAPKKQQPDTTAAGNETISSFSSPSSSLSSSTKSTKLNIQKLSEFFVDSPDIYREIGVDCDDLDDEEDDAVMAEINIGPATSRPLPHHANNYNFGVVSQKSASIDHLNLASCFAKPSKSNPSKIANTTSYSNSHTNNPPPNIQPCSGVLSKSLHSLVLKPQPLKPVVELQTASNVVPLRPVLGGKANSCFSNQHQFLLKSKCASTTNLVQASTAPLAPNLGMATKSVNFLAANSKLSESDDSLDIDETASSTSDSTASEASGQQVEIVVDNRQVLQERLSSLQVMYDELKANFEKDLERDGRAMRSRLAESREYSAKLAKALSRCKCQGKKGVVGEDEELLKRSQAENCELRARLEAERRQFEAEREEWMAEKERVLQFQGYLQGQRAVKADMKQAGESPGQVQAKKSLASHMQFLQQKLSLSQQQSKKDLLKPQHQFMPSKLFAQSMLAKSSRDVNSEKANSSSVSSCGASYASSQSHRIRQQQHNNFL